MSAARIGVFGIGLEAYWDQFDGLKEKLMGLQRHVETQLLELGAEVIGAGVVDSHPSAQTAAITSGHAVCSVSIRRGPRRWMRLIAGIRDSSLEFSFGRHFADWRGGQGRS